MLKPTNFSARHEASVKVFVKAKEELTQLHQDLLNEEDSAAKQIADIEKHVVALKKRREAVSKSLDAIRSVIG